MRSTTAWRRDRAPRALLVIALAALQAGDVGAGMGPLEQSLQLYELAGDDRGAAFALLFLGQTDASRQRFEQVGDVAGEAFALATAAELLVIDDRLDEAASTFQASRLRAEAAEDRRAVAQALNGLGLVELLLRSRAAGAPVASSRVRRCVSSSGMTPACGFRS